MGRMDKRRRWIFVQSQFLGYATVVILNRPKSFIFDLKCTKIARGWGGAPDPAGGAYSAPPDPLAVTGEGRGGEGRGLCDFSPNPNFLATPLFRGQTYENRSRWREIGGIYRGLKWFPWVFTLIKRPWYFIIGLIINLFCLESCNLYFVFRKIGTLYCPDRGKYSVGTECRKAGLSRRNRDSWQPYVESFGFGVHLCDDDTQFHDSCKSTDAAELASHARHRVCEGLDALPAQGSSE